MSDKAACAHKNAHRLIPTLALKDAKKAFELYKKAFGAVEAYPPLMCPQTHVLAHGALKIGASELFLSEARPEAGCPASAAQSFMIYVPDADAAIKTAVAAGMKEDKPAEDMFWGDRMGTIADPYGNKWAFATHIRDVSTEEMAEAMKKMGSKAA